MKYLVAILLVFTPFCVQAGTIDPAVPDSKYVEYGEKYECVLPIMGVMGDQLNSQFRASCVVINENYRFEKIKQIKYQFTGSFSSFTHWSL